MDYIETKVADRRVGRLCKLRADWRPRFPTEDGKDAIVRAGAELVILPQLGIPPGVSFDNVFKDFNLVSSLVHSKVNLEIVGKYIGETLTLPVSMHQPTEYMLLDASKIDWKSVVCVGRSYALTDNILETLLSLRGVKGTFEFLQYFHSFQENFVLVTCPSCQRDSILDVSRNLYCQNPGCEYKLGRDVTSSELKKRFAQNPTKAVTITN